MALKKTLAVLVREAAAKAAQAQPPQIVHVTNPTHAHHRPPVLCHDYYSVIFYVFYIFYSNINMCLVVLAVACNAIILHVVLILYIVQ